MSSPVIVSIVIPCYEQAHLLPHALSSALTQGNLQTEIIVVDDGSTQDVASIVATQAPNARYIRQDNQGLSSARNAGLSASRGRFVAFLDADDRLLDSGIAAGLDCFRRHPEAAFVFGGYTNVNSAGGTTNPPVVPREGPVSYAMLLRRNIVGMHGTVLYRRDVVDRIGGFDTLLRSCEDYDLYLRIARCQEVYAHTALVAEYRRHDGTLSGHHVQMIETGLAVLKAQRPFSTSAELRTAYRAAFRFIIAKHGYHILGHALARLIRGDMRQGIEELAAFVGRLPRWLFA